ncbi:MAG TPA: hypothetical protein VLV49_07775 [Terriglobales bacterium]|nr:hypothetical protein [Terriglobales bacterium]
MDEPTKQKPQQNSDQAAQHLVSAHKILKALQEKMGEHPEIGAAITKIEMALNVLEIKTGALL